MADDQSKPQTTEESAAESKDQDMGEEEVKQESVSKENKGEEPPKKEESPKKEKDSPKKETKKETKASPKKEAKKEEKEDGDKKNSDSNEEDDDEEEEELPLGLLEQPLEVTGKREKKKVERLTATMVPLASAEKKKLEIEEGSGEKLGDIPYIEHQLAVTKAIDLKPLHRLLFARLGTSHELKRNIRQFSGFTYDKDSKDYEKKLTTLNKFVLNELKTLCLVLGLDRGGTKKDLVDRIMEFLMKPSDTGAQIKAKRRSKSASATKGKKRKRTTKKDAKKSASSKKKKKEKDSEEEEEEEDEKDAEEGDDDDDDEEEEEAEKDSEDEEPKKKKAKTEPKKKAEEKKKTPAKKVAKENGKKEKAPPKETKKSTPKKKKTVSSDDDLSDDSDDEPIAKMKKPSPPSNDEIKALVKKILDGADLETVTMKTVVKQVYAKYPTFDLSDRKDFIKDTVREVIS